MKKILTIIISIVLVSNLVSAAYLPGTIVNDNTEPEQGYEFYTTDSMANVHMIKDEINNNWNKLDDTSKENLAEQFGLSSDMVESAISNSNHSLVPILGQDEAISPLLSPAIIKSSTPWDYNKNMYCVRTESFKNFTDKYPFSNMFTDNEYELFYTLSKRYKFDYLIILAKWNYQSAHNFHVELTRYGMAHGLAGQLIGEDGKLAHVKDVFTSDEISDTSGECIINTINDTVGGGSPGPRTDRLTLSKAKQGFDLLFPGQSDIWKNIAFLGTISNDTNLQRAKMQYNAVCEWRLVMSSITSGKERQIHGDWQKIRSILDKDWRVWSDEEYNILFGDLADSDKVISEFDNLPEWKQKAYLYLKHWCIGSSDSGRAYIDIGKISEYIINNDFDLEAGKKFIYQAIDSSIIASVGANGKEPTRNMYKTYFSNEVFYGAAGGQYQKLIVGLDKDKCLALCDDPTVTDYKDIFLSSFDTDVESSSLMKGVLFALGSFMNKKLDVLSMSEHGACHGGMTRQQLYLNSKANGCPIFENGSNGVKYNAGGSYVIYNTSINYWLGDGNWVR